MSAITTLSLHHFRCYEALKLQEVHKGLVVLFGPNGAGKTNVLEAVSLLTPGRGLRGESHEEIQRISPLSVGLPPAGGGNRGGMQEGWSISSRIDLGGSDILIGTGFDVQSNKRIVKINGAMAKSQIALADYLSCLWLTPQMDRIFIDSAGGRRRFFDKLVFTFDPAHAGRVTRYENAMAQRSKLLRDGMIDTAWIQSLEQQMAQTGVAIAAARLAFLERLQKACDTAHGEEELYFPKARLFLSGSIEELLDRLPAVEVESMAAYAFTESRLRDAQTGGAATGAHKTDLKCLLAAKNMPADQCSTGEQKALLIGIILAHARLMRIERGAPPIVLLDEVAAHLDENRRAALFDLLEALGGQVWMTGTEFPPFSMLEKRAQFWAVDHALITPK